MRGMKSWIGCGVVLVALLAGCGDNDPVSPDVFPPAGASSSEVPRAWFDLYLTLTKQTAGFTPPVASRAFGYAGVALYEALVPGMPGHQTLAGQLNDLNSLPEPEAGSDYDWPTVANSVLASMARHLYPTATVANLEAITNLEAQFSDPRPAGVSEATFERSTTRGRVIADAIFIWSLSDGGHEGYLRNFPASYVPPVGPGLWEPTPRPGGLPPLPALQPYWGANRPFVLAAGGNPNVVCEPAAPTAFSTDTNSQCFAEAIEVYAAVNNITAEEEAIARFWSDDAGTTPTPPGHSISILTQVLVMENASLATAAEAYAKVGIAVADAFISCWSAKYQFNLLRPITYINQHIDTAWAPLLATPPFPEHTSGHSVQSGAAFGVMEELFGASYAFVDHTHDARGLPAHSFASFDAAASEAAISRLYGGIHFRPAIEAGITQGRCIAGEVAALDFLRPRRER
ncbi:MAG: vanadium-dependent haloperoxidase [bacterium]